MTTRTHEASEVTRSGENVLAQQASLPRPLNPILASLLLLASVALASTESAPDPDRLLRLGREAYQQDDMERALALLEQAAKLAPQHSEIQRALGDAYGRSAQQKGIFGGLGLGRKCLAAYQRAVELDPANVEAHLSLFEYYRQAPAFVGGSIEKATTHANIVKQLDPPRGRDALATLHIGEKEYDLAFAEFEEVLRSAPDDYAALFQTGRIAAVTGQRVDAGLAALRRCLALTPPPHQPAHAEVQWRIGSLLERKRDLAGARSAYAAALQADPNFTAAAEALRKLK